MRLIKTTWEYALIIKWYKLRWWAFTIGESSNLPRGRGLRPSCRAGYQPTRWEIESVQDICKSSAIIRKQRSAHRQPYIAGAQPEFEIGVLALHWRNSDNRTRRLAAASYTMCWRQILKWASWWHFALLLQVKRAAWNRIDVMMASIKMIHSLYFIMKTLCEAIACF